MESEGVSDPFVSEVRFKRRVQLHQNQVFIIIGLVLNILDFKFLLT